MTFMIHTYDEIEFFGKQQLDWTTMELVGH
jgi:hypothetical protein